MAAETNDLRIFGENYYNVTGFIAEDPEGNSHTFIVPSGTYTLTELGPVDISSYEKVQVPEAHMVIDSVTQGVQNGQYVIRSTIHVNQPGYVTDDPSAITYVRLQTVDGRTVIPSQEQVVITGNKWLNGNITIRPIPTQYINPSGTMTITSNGSYLVRNVNNVVVNVV